MPETKPAAEARLLELVHELEIDLVVLARYAVRVNGLTELFMTKLDVLSSWERVPVCVAYDVDGVRHDEMPMTQSSGATCSVMMRRRA
jgi:adenylosuccinate synthase